MIRKTISDQLKSEYIDAIDPHPTTKNRIGVTPITLLLLFNGLKIQLTTLRW
jgi:hypothetical protein